MVLNSIKIHSTKDTRSLAEIIQIEIPYEAVLLNLRETIINATCDRIVSVITDRFLLDFWEDISTQIDKEAIAKAATEVVIEKIRGGKDEEAKTRKG